MMDNWDQYSNWNLAVAEVIYGAHRAGLPSYLDLEDETLVNIRDIAEPTCVNPATGLQEAVLGTLTFGSGPAEVFKQHLTRLDQWRRGNLLSEPPILALLAVLSLAAENMHDGEGKAANNFYGRLAELLALNESEKDEFVGAYRRIEQGLPCSELLWASLTSWLERNEGNRGLPTAYAAGHTHIGLPLSQALVRQTDRERLTDAFTTYGLSPRSTLDKGEMRILLEEWLSRAPCPASNSFARLWRHDESARERIVDVACLELASWDGVRQESDGVNAERHDRLRLIANLSTFLSHELRLTLGLPAASDQAGEQFELIDRDGQPLGVLDFVVRTAGWLVSSATSIIDPLSILLGDIRLQRVNDGGTATRQPRRLIPLRFDSVLQAYVEQDRVSLGEEHLLLAHPKLVDQLDPVIEGSARSGFTRHDAMPGLPDGWVLYDRVQILSSVPPDLIKHLDLRALQPLARTQVVLEGGLKIPGNIAKWSTHRPPELRVTSEESATLRAHIRTIRALAEPPAGDRHFDSVQPVMIWSLSDEHLQDGDYEVTVYDDDGALGNPLTLRLRTADNPALRVSNESVVMLHRAADALFGIGARQGLDTNGFEVAPSDAPVAQTSTAAVDHIPHWWTSRHEANTGTNTTVLVAPQADAESCVFTGAHHLLLDAAIQGQSTVEGVCKYCGLVKRQPAWRARRKRKSTKQDQQPPQISVHRLAPIPDHEQLSWMTGYDTVCHIGEGSASALLAVAAQVESGQFFGDGFVRRLDTLGHIEVERDDADLTVKRWRVADPTLVGLTDGRWCLVGLRSDRLLAALDDFAYEHKFDIEFDTDISGPPRVAMPTLDHDVESELLDLMTHTTGRPSKVIPDASLALATTLPPLSALLQRLPTVPIFTGRGTEKWNPTSARFEHAVDVNSQGAFRINAFGRTYLYRRAVDMGAMQAMLGDARIVKYAAALETGQSLIGYDATQHLLYVPLGADLPGLFGRAAVLATGRPPIANLEQRALEYRGVPPQVAAILIDKVMS